MTIAVIADIVGSRRLNDRAQAQRTIERCIEEVERHAPTAMRAFAPTVGDEFQAEYACVEDALHALLLLQLLLPSGIECRFGIGVGETSSVPSRTGHVLDGPGWWAARDAIEHVHSLEDRAAPRARTWIAVSEQEDDAMRTHAAVANAYVAVRDHVVGGMNDRARRIVAGRLVGTTQAELARREGITQSAVSQALAAAGAPAILVGVDVLASRGEGDRA